MQPNPRWRRALAVPAALLAILTVAHAGAPVFTNDAFWHVATGRHLLEVGGFPARDPFSFTAGDQDWVLHEWLTQVIFAAVHALSGMGGLRFLTAACTGLALWLVASLYRRELGAGAALLGLIAFVALGWPRLQTRPTLFTILAILCLVRMWTRQGSPWRIRDGALVVALQLLWTNAHSVALLGPLLYSVFLAGLWLETRLAARGARGFPAPTPGDLRRHAWTFVGTVAASLCTPSGIDLFGFAWQDKGTVMQYVDDEWAPFHLAYAENPSLPLETWLGVLATIGVLLVTWFAVGLALNGERDKLRSPMLPAPTRILLALALFGGGLLARRFHWLHALTLLFCLRILLDLLRHGGLARLGPAVRAPLTRCAAGVAGAGLALWLGLAVLRAEDRPLPAALVGPDYWNRPVAAAFDLDGVAFLVESGIEGHVVCHYGSGGILSYHGYPALKVSIDSRIDLYRRAVYLDYVAIRDRRPDQQALLDRYGADVYYQHWELGPPVDAAAWLPVWQSREGAIMLRRGAARTPANLERIRAWQAARRTGLPAAARPATPR